MDDDLETQNSEASIQLKKHLVQIAGIDLYNENGFQILSLPIGAKAPEITKRQQMFENNIKHQMPIHPGKGVSISDKPIKDEFILSEVVERLRSPEKRIVDEFFWLWPSHHSPESDEVAHNFIRQGDLASAIEHWKNQLPLDKNNGIALHNLTVISHAQVLQHEVKLLHEKNKHLPIGKGQDSNGPVDETNISLIFVIAM